VGFMAGRASKAPARGWPRLGRRCRTDEGAVALEFALVLPIFLLLVLGTIQYGVYFWAAQGGSTAVREAARRAAVGDFPTCTDFRNDVKERIDSLGDEATAVISRSYSKGPGNIETGVEVGDVVTVTVSFRSPTMNFPIIPFLEDGTVSETADARVENVPTSAVETC
jgi:Flp pilus assembly protein TadG